MIRIALFLCLFQNTLTTMTSSHLSNRREQPLNAETSVKDLGSVLGLESNTNGCEWNTFQVVTIAEGAYIGRDIEIAHRSLELSGQRSSQTTGLGTRIVTSCEPKRKNNADIGDIPTVTGSLFALANSTLSLIWMQFSLVDTSAEAGTARLAVVSSSMLSIWESVLELSRWTSPILVSSSTILETRMESSVVVNTCSISSESGQMAGLVETSAFPDCGASRSVSIVGCSFNSQQVLGKHGIGLSLTRTARRMNGTVGIISSSLIGSSFVNMSSIGSSRQPHLPHLSQKMLGCVVSWTSSHLSGSTIRDVNNGGSVLCSNSSFSSLLPSPNTNPDSSESTATSPSDFSSQPFVDGAFYTFTNDSGNENSIAEFSNCRFTGTAYDIFTSPEYDVMGYPFRPLFFWDYKGSVSIDSCSFTNFIANPFGGGAVLFKAYYPPDHYVFEASLSNFTNCLSKKFGGAVGLKNVGETLVKSCRFENCTETKERYGSQIFEGGGGLSVSRIPSSGQVDLVDCVFADCSAEYGGGVFCDGFPLTLSVVGSRFERCKAFIDPKESSGGGIHAFMPDFAVVIKECEFIECSTATYGAAVYCRLSKDVIITDTLVRKCFSGLTSAIFVYAEDNYENLSFSHLVFDGNSIGAASTSSSNDKCDYDRLTKQIMIDFALHFSSYTDRTFTFEDCFSTVSPYSSGVTDWRGEKIYKEVPSVLYPQNYYEKDYIQIGPYLTDFPTARLNERTGLVELEMKAKTPLTVEKLKLQARNM
ncbi:hypothetical protein BLNAU_17221 [Blattamonas nauphoetae]|uniref:Uncharacterized protein n=1 Tax=Blattamonas nauphoetae TaxID=2049346 RepID=A0ABQ9XBZ9_9EUKA|nr:hypothetical protein BLNAU_17221 [Blattamonas nauphoetae]